jgi:transposase
MPKPYSEDLRSRVDEAVAAGHTVRAVTLQYHVSSASVCRMHALWREIGAVQGKPFGGLNAQLEPSKLLSSRSSQSHTWMRMVGLLAV